MTLGARCDAVLAMIDAALGPPEDETASRGDPPAPVGAAASMDGDPIVAAVET
jgi:hypothetical protein